MALQQTLQKVTTDDILFRAKNAAAAGTLMSYSVTDGYVEKISGSPDVVLTKVAGVLLINVEDRAIPSNLTLIGDDTGTVDLPRNFNRNVTYTSGVVRLLRIGTCETDQVDASATFGQGSGVYIGDDGLFTTNPVEVSGVGTAERVGTALSSKRDGFVRVFVNIK